MVSVEVSIYGALCWAAIVFCDMVKYSRVTGELRGQIHRSPNQRYL